MVEGVGVSDEQLDQWENYRLGVGFAGLGMREQRALLGEVRASHAREAEAVADRDELMAEVTAAARRIREAEAERDVLQQSIDKALELSEYERDNLLALLKAVSGWGGPSVLSAANTGDWVMQVAGKLNPAGPEEGDWGRPNVSAEGMVRAVNERVAAVRAALTGTGDTE